MDSFDRMYSVKEVSAITGWSTDTVRRMIYRGHLKAVTLPRSSGRRGRIYRSTRISESALRTFLKANQN